MILTLTLNPAVDVSLTTERIVYDDRAYITSETFQAGGKGINAARVIHGYGGEVRSIAPYGGAMGERFRELIEASAVPVTLIRVAGETRRNVAITDAQGLTLKLDQIGAPLSAEELGRIDEAVRAVLAGADWLMLTGSLPPEVPRDYYARVIEAARKRGVKTLLDTSGDALPLALEAGPTIAKPNRPEAEKLLNRSLLSEAQSVEAAEDILRLGPEHVILSLGAQGAVAVWEGGKLRSLPPGVQTGSPIGAGDVLAATAVWALSRGESFAEAFAVAVAAATVAAAQPGLGCGSIDEIKRMRERMEIRKL